MCLYIYNNNNTSTMKKASKVNLHVFDESVRNVESAAKNNQSL